MWVRVPPPVHKGDKMNGKKIVTDHGRKMLGQHSVAKSEYYNKMRRDDIFDILEEERKQRVAAAEALNADLLKKYAHIPHTTAE